MRARSVPRVRSLILVLGVAACDAAPSRPRDANAADAGTSPRVDGSGPRGDGGETRPDGGGPRRDAGGAQLDAANPAGDAGTPPPIGGFPPAPPSPGSTYVVAQGGNDDGPCSEAEPCATIAGGIAKLSKSGGDRLLIKDGTYRENPWGPNVAIKGFSGSPQAWTTIAAYPGHTPVLSISNANPNGDPTWQNVLIESSSYVHLQGLELAGDRQTVKGETNNVHVKSSNHVNVWGNAIHDAGGSGIAAQHSDHLDVRGNRIWGNANWSCYGQSGISFNSMSDLPGSPDANGYSLRIVGNLLWENEQLVPSTCIGASYITDGNCIIFDLNNDSGYSGKSLVKNNICAAHGSRCLHALTSDNVDWVHNTCYRNVRTSDATNSQSGEITITHSATHRFEGNLVVPRPDRDPWRDWSDNTATMVFTGNAFVKTGFSVSGAGNVVLPDGTPVLQAPQDDASGGDWTAIGQATGFGAPWPLSAQ